MAVRKDPVSRAPPRRCPHAGPMQEAMDAPDAPLELALDMPSGALPMAGNVSGACSRYRHSTAAIPDP